MNFEYEYGRRDFSTYLVDALTYAQRRLMTHSGDYERTLPDARDLAWWEEHYSWEATVDLLRELYDASPVVSEEERLRRKKAVLALKASGYSYSVIGQQFNICGSTARAWAKYGDPEKSIVPYTRQKVQDKMWCDYCKRTGPHPKKKDWRLAIRICRLCGTVLCDRHNFCYCQSDD